MFEPVGPLPESVYRRRQAVALAGLVVVLLLVIWGIRSLGGDPNQPATDGRALVGPVTSTPQPPSSSPSASSSSTVSTPPTPTSVAPAVPPPPPPGPPAPCPDASIGMAAQTDKPAYQVGERPVFRLVVTNTGIAPCVRDLAAALQEMAVLSADGAIRLWSSNDCAPGDRDEVRTLAPGEQMTFSISWAGRTSAPGCPEERQTVPAGEYQLVTRLDTVTSAPAPFRLLH